MACENESWYETCNRKRKPLLFVRARFEAQPTCKTTQGLIVDSRRQRLTVDGFRAHSKQEQCY